MDDDNVELRVGIRQRALDPTTRARNAMQQHRDSRRRIGMKHTSCLIPMEDKHIFDSYVAMLNAKYLVKLVTTLPPESPQRQVIGNFNFTKVPDPEEIRELMKDIDNITPDITRDCKSCLAAINEYNIASRLLQNKSLTDLEISAAASRAVAYSALAAAIWKDIQNDL